MSAPAPLSSSNEGLPPGGAEAKRDHHDDSPGDGPHALPAKHRRNRKSWTAEQQREFWKRKKIEQKQRKKGKAAGRKSELQAQWEAMPAEERERRRTAAMVAHDLRRQLEEESKARSVARLADPRTPVLVFDLSFAWCMTPSHTKSTVQQLKFSYSALRAEGFPFKPAFTSLTGREPGDAEHDASRQAPLLAVLNKYSGFDKFPPRIAEQEHWSTLYPREKVVFLTADAEETLTDIADDTVYVIGAFVDHNKLKGLSRAAAERHGVRTAKLPIKESIDVHNRCLVLTINHVVDVLVRYMVSRTAGAGGDWKAALEAALPVRRVQQEAPDGRRKRSRLTPKGSQPGSVSSGDFDEMSDADDAKPSAKPSAQ